MGDLECDVHRFLDRQRAGGFDSLADCGSLDILEGDVMEVAIVPDTEDPGDVFVIELSGRSAFLVKSLDDFHVARLIWWEELQSDLAVEERIESTKDRSHAPSTDRFFQQEAINLIARLRQYGRRGWGGGP
jgi:hypothetical protein